MSLELTRSNKVECKSYPIEILDGIISIGEHDIHPEDFCELVMYFLTNTDLYVDDPRMDLIKRVFSLKPVSGFSEGAYRLEEEK